jgi:hypothetical protein
LLDYLAELLAEGHPPDWILPLAKRYLRRCPGCQAEFQAALADMHLGGREGNSP